MEIMKDKEYSFVFPKGFFVNIFLSPTNYDCVLRFVILYLKFIFGQGKNGFICKCVDDFLGIEFITNPDSKLNESVESIKLGRSMILSDKKSSYFVQPYEDKYDYHYNDKNSIKGIIMNADFNSASGVFSDFPVQIIKCMITSIEEKRESVFNNDMLEIIQYIADISEDRKEDIIHFFKVALGHTN